MMKVIVSEYLPSNLTLHTLALPLITIIMLHGVVTVCVCVCEINHDCIINLLIKQCQITLQRFHVALLGHLIAYNICSMCGFLASTVAYMDVMLANSEHAPHSRQELMPRRMRCFETTKCSRHVFSSQPN